MKLACTPGPLHLSLTSSAHNRQAFLLLFSLGEKKINFLENVACRVEVCAFCCKEPGAARPPPWSILVFWAMTKAVVVDDVRRDYVRKVTCPQPLKRCPFSTYV